MSSALSPASRKALALGLLLALLLLADTLVLAPWRDWQSAVQARTATTRTLLARTRAATHDAMRADTETDRQPASAAGPDALLAAGEETRAVAELQTLLRAAAMAEGITLASLQVDPTGAAEAGARRLGLRVSVETGFAPLLRLLHRLESGRPVLRVRGLELQVSGTGEDPTLAATLEVVALMAPTAP